MDDVDDDCDQCRGGLRQADVTADGHREEREIASADEYQALLREHFGIELGDDADAERLLHPGEAA